MDILQAQRDHEAEMNNFNNFKAQAAERQFQKLNAIIGLASQDDQEDVPLAPVKRLGLNGASTGRYFEFPQLT